MMKPFPHYQQLDSMDCGPSCLRMIAKYYGRCYSLQNLRERSFITRQGVSMLGISDAAESIGMRTQGVRISLQQLVEDVPLPCILHWNQNHFVVLYNVKKKRKVFSKTAEDYTFSISDPAKGKYPIDKAGFEKCWISTKEEGSWVRSIVGSHTRISRAHRRSGTAKEKPLFLSAIPVPVQVTVVPACNRNAAGKCFLAYPSFPDTSHGRSGYRKQ